MRFKIEDWVGKKFNRLTVMEEGLSYRDKKSNKIVRIVKCKCDCGNITETGPSRLKTGITKSCGCIQKEKLKLRSISHGKSYTPEYRAWRDMKNRCYNISNKYYDNYGGRGISVHPPWVDSFQEFFNYVGERPSNNYSLDRPNVNGNYEPGNVKWATTKEQAIHRTDNVMLEMDEEWDTQGNWSRKLGITRTYIKMYIQKGLSLSQIVSQYQKYLESPFCRSDTKIKRKSYDER